MSFLVSRWSIRTIAKLKTTVKLLFIYCDCERKRPKSKAPPPQCSFSPPRNGSRWGSVEYSVQGMTSLLRIPNKSSCTFRDSGDKERDRERGNEWKNTESGFKWLSLPKGYLYASTPIDIKSIIKLLYFRRK